MDCKDSHILMKKADHNGNQKSPHYQRIARQLKSAIEHGELAPGSRLPASRVYAQELGVSRATVENAWGELVAQGWLERRGQAGTFISERLSPRGEPARRPTDIAPTAPRRFSWGCRRWIFSPRPVGAGDGRRLRTQTRFDLGARRSVRRDDPASGHCRLSASFPQY